MADNPGYEIDPRHALEAAVALLRSGPARPNQMPGVALRSRPSRAPDEPSSEPPANHAAVAPRASALDTALLLVDAHGTIITATKAAAHFVVGGDVDRVVGRPIDELARLVTEGARDHDTGSVVGALAHQALPIRVELARRGVDDASVEAVIDHAHGLAGATTYAIILVLAPRAPAARDWNFATARCLAEIGAATIEEPNFGSFMRRCARTLRNEAGVSALRIRASVGTDASATASSSVVGTEYPEREPTHVREVTFQSRVGDESSRYCMVAVLDSWPCAGARAMLERTCAALHTAISKRVAEERLVHLAAHFNSLDTISSALTSTANEPLALAEIVASRVSSAHGTACLVEIFDPSTGALECRTAGGADDALALELVAYLTAAQAEDPMLYAMPDTTRPGSSISTHDPEDTFSLGRLRASGLDVGSAMAVSIRADGRNIGWIAVCRRHDVHAVVEEDEVFFRAMADRLGLAVSNSWLFRENREHVALLEERVRERTLRYETAIEDLQVAQSELVHAEKLSSLGALVAGVAHELNTPIGNAVMVATTLEARVAEFKTKATNGAIRRSDLEQFVATCDNAGQLLTRCLSSARDLIGTFKQVAADQTSEQRRTFDLGTTTRDFVDMLMPSIKNHAIVVEVAPGMPIAMDSYPGALGRVVTNLVQNAVVHAFDGRESGRITVETSRIGDYVACIEVTDDGVGITSDALPHIFDPFFTTKLGRGGSGLGLQIVFNLVTNVLGGRVDVRTELGRGSTFRVVVPCTTPTRLHAAGGLE